MQNWKWVTGEPWNYTNWDHARPTSSSGYDYLSIDGSLRDSDNPWDNISITSNLSGYICEWSTNDYADTALVPDMNGNGVAEIASLYVNHKNARHTVVIKDGATKKVLSRLSFGKSVKTPLGMVVLSDINNNGNPEIGVLTTYFGMPAVQIKDVRNNKKILRTITFLSPAYRPKAVSVAPDADGNGFDKIVVLGVHKKNGKASVQTRDSKYLNLPAFSVNF